MATYFDKEINIIKDIQNHITTRECMILSDEEKSDKYYETAAIIDNILDEDQFKKLWKDHSGKNITPPDFINDSENLMMEVMRIDDHVCTLKENVYKQLESKRYKEIKDKLNISDDIEVNLIIDTQLPTNEDHNYIAYRDNFNRVVINHLKKIKKYKNNRPNYKTIFLVFDESSGSYFEQIKENYGKQHFFFWDNNFIECFLKSDLDYFIWYAPYKLAKSIECGIIEYPKVIIYDVKSYKNVFGCNDFKYNPKRMVSNEK